MSPGRWLTACAFVLAVAAGVGAAAGAAQDKNALPAAIGDLEQAQLIEVRDQGGQILLHGTLKTSDNAPKATTRKAELRSPTGQKAKGKVEIEIERTDGVIAKEAVEVKLENLPTMTPCELALDGKHVTSFLTTKAGKAELKLERKVTSRD
jgi:hypothetical protein